MLSSFAKADDPVTEALAILIVTPVITGCPAAAEHDIVLCFD